MRAHRGQPEPLTRNGACCAIRSKKTGGRLTSDPIRTSLGLLPSGPDPVGEWLVHRQSPGSYLEPKQVKSKPGWRAGPRPVQKREYG